MNDFPLGPMSVGTILDRTFKIYRNHFKAIILFAVLIGGTANLIIALLSLGPGAFQAQSLFGSIFSNFSGDASLDAMQQYLSNLQNLSPFGAVLSILFNILVSPLVTGGLTLLVLTICLNRPAPEQPGGWLSLVKPFFGKLVGTALASYLILVGLALVLIIPTFIIGAISGGWATAFIMALIFLAFFAIIFPYSLLIYPVVMEENRFGFRFFGRTFQLLFQKFWKSLGVFIVTTLVINVLSIAIGLVTFFLPQAVSAVLDVIITAFLSPIPIIAAVLLYLDIRITREGYDLELRQEMIVEEQMEEQEEPVL